MPGSDVWRGIWLKVERAKDHVRELDRRVGEFMQRKPYTTAVNREQVTGHHVICALVNEQPPAWWGTIAGDAVQNLRSALDLTVYQLVLASGGTPSASTGFPIAETPDEYAEISAGRLAGLGVEVQELVHRLRPYRYGNPALWRLNRLDAAGRQVGIQPVAAATKSLIDVFSNLDFPNTPIPISPGYPYKAVFPIENGTELARVARAHTSSQLNVNAQGAFYIAFGEPAVIQGEPLLPTLRTLIRVTESAVQPLLRPLIAG
jgi:hypothetical protein